MKTFNLEEALAGKPVITRDGRKVTEIHHFKTVSDDEKFSVFSVIDGIVYSHYANGSYLSNEANSGSDLFMEEPIVECWVNVYYWDGRIFTSRSFSTKEQAIAIISNEDRNYIETIKINYEKNTNTISHCSFN